MQFGKSYKVMTKEKLSVKSSILRYLVTSHFTVGELMLRDPVNFPTLLIWQRERAMIISFLPFLYFFLCSFLPSFLPSLLSSSFLYSLSLFLLSFSFYLSSTLSLPPHFHIPNTTRQWGYWYKNIMYTL